MIEIGKLPTLGAFIDIACSEHRAVLKNERTRTVVDGGPVMVRYLERTIDGKSRHAIIEGDDGEELTPHLLRYLCVRLDIPTILFDMPLRDAN